MLLNFIEYPPLEGSSFQLLEFGSCCGEGLGWQWGMLWLCRRCLWTPLCALEQQHICNDLLALTQGPVFFPQRKSWQGICGFWEIGWEPFPRLLPPLLPLQRAFTTINKYQVCVLQELQDRSFSFSPQRGKRFQANIFCVILGEVVAGLQIPFSAHLIPL